MTKILVVLFALAAFASAANHVRFINNFEGQTIQITTTNAGSFNLAYKAISDYVEVAASTVTVTQVSNQGGINWNTADVNVELNGYTTVVAGYDAQGNFALTNFTETLPTEIDSSKAYVRIISLGGAVGQISLAQNGQPVLTQVGNLMASNYAALSVPANNLWLYQSGGQISNTYTLNLGNGLVAGSAFTIFWFTPQTGSPSGSLILDRQVAEPSTTASAGTSGEVATGSTSGSASPNFVRFMNALEGQTITITTDNAGTFTLSYKQVSEYVQVNSATTIVLTVTNQLAVALIPVSVTVQLDGYTTFAAQWNTQGDFSFLRFEETLPADVDLSANLAYIRVISLGGGVGAINIALGGVPIFTNIGNLQFSNYVSVPAETAASSLWIYQSGGMIANTYPITDAEVFGANGAYTIFWFTPTQSGSAGAEVVMDRNLAGLSMTTGMNQITSGNMGMSTGAPVATTGSVAASTGSQDGNEDDTPNTSDLDTIDPEGSSASAAVFSAILVVLAAIL
eukprot:TRINITY_DN116_c0_g1_i2.p1 TRINITY_DN116_c0_g1~~TRINITY_DN116_c0_g1_i2.p1  ORF type:complete len:511 (+),score=171.59 TRINITY_DN116_c0_g1_i2:135-1667(+)